MPTRQVQPATFKVQHALDRRALGPESGGRSVGMPRALSQDMNNATITIFVVRTRMGGIRATFHSLAKAKAWVALVGEDYIISEEVY